MQAEKHLETSEKLWAVKGYLAQIENLQHSYPLKQRNTEDKLFCVHIQAEHRYNDTNWYCRTLGDFTE
jgi:hypothetical protein